MKTTMDICFLSIAPNRVSVNATLSVSVKWLNGDCHFDYLKVIILRSVKYAVNQLEKLYHKLLKGLPVVILEGYLRRPHRQLFVSERLPPVSRGRLYKTLNHFF